MKIKQFYGCDKNHQKLRRERWESMPTQRVRGHSQDRMTVRKGCRQSMEEGNTRCARCVTHPVCTVCAGSISRHGDSERRCWGWAMTHRDRSVGEKLRNGQWLRRSRQSCGARVPRQPRRVGVVVVNTMALSEAFGNQSRLVPVY